MHILPSDRYSYDVRHVLAEKYKISPNIRHVDLTKLYNYYTDNFEIFVSKMCLQNNLTLFKFIVEYYISVMSNIRFIYYSDGFYPNSNKDIITDLDYELIAKFIDNNGIPLTGENITDTRLLLIKYNGVFENFVNILKERLIESGVDPTQTGLLTDDNQDIVHLPLSWTVTKTDILDYMDMDLDQYTAIYPYHKKIDLYLGSLSPLDISYIDTGYIESVLENCLEPIYTQLG